MHGTVRREVAMAYLGDFLKRRKKESKNWMIGSLYKLVILTEQSQNLKRDLWGERETVLSHIKVRQMFWVWCHPNQKHHKEPSTATLSNVRCQQKVNRNLFFPFSLPFHMFSSSVIFEGFCISLVWR